jgi:hypothetical protein
MTKTIRKGGNKSRKKRAAKRKTGTAAKPARAKSKTTEQARKKSGIKRKKQTSKKKSHKKKSQDEKSRDVKKTRNKRAASKATGKRSKKGPASKKKGKTSRRRTKKPARKKPKGATTRRRPVFLAYRRVDRKLMRELRRDLRQHGIEVWTDEGLPLGTKVWTRTIESRISESRYLILILTPRTRESDHILTELDVARDHGVTVIPLWREGRQLADVKFYEIRLMNIRNAKSKRNYKKTLRQLVNILG